MASRKASLRSDRDPPVYIAAHQRYAPTVQRPPLVWGKDPWDGDMVALNGAQVQVAEFPDLVSATARRRGVTILPA